MESTYHLAKTRWWDLLHHYGQRGYDPRSIGNWDPRFIRKTLPVQKFFADHYYRATVEGLGHIPEGPYVIAGPHGGGPMNVIADNMVLGTRYYQAKGFARPLFFIGHHSVFVLGPIGRVMAKYGAVEGNHETAMKVLRAGQGFVVFPGGEEDMARPFWNRNRVDFRGHTGFVEAALEAGAPILPLGSVGGTKPKWYWPPSTRSPRRSISKTGPGSRPFPFR